MITKIIKWHFKDRISMIELMYVTLLAYSVDELWMFIVAVLVGSFIYGFLKRQINQSNLKKGNNT